MTDELTRPVNHLKQKLKAGGWAACMPIRVSRVAQVIHMVRAACMDAIYVDMEHSTVTLEHLSQLCLAARETGVTPMVRVPTNDPITILRTLEGGAAGIIIPHVDTPEAAQAAVDAVRFAPVGKRALAGASVLVGYAPLPADEVGRRLNDATVLIVMLESLKAIENAEAIAAIDGIDILLIGTGDLTEELGIHGKYDDSRVLDAYQTVAEACRRHNRTLGVAGIKGKTPVLGQLYRLGARFVTTRTDEALLLSAIREEAQVVSRLFAEPVK